MTTEQIVIFAILGGMIAAFAWGRWRHDMVALAALLVSVAIGLVPQGQAFSGFAHPAVITVAAVLILSRGLQDSGAIDMAARRILPRDASPVQMIAGLTGLAALVSGFMNNVGALALLMPLGIRMAHQAGMPPGRFLMPLAFGSILGGMTTLIGTPPNLIVSGYRQELAGEAFGMFDFAPAGVAIAVAGVAFISLVGWRLVPHRDRAGVEGFESGTYFTEARVPQDARAVGMTLRDIEQGIEDAGVQILALIRNDLITRTPSLRTKARAGDILLLEAEPGGLGSILSELGIQLGPDEAAEAEAEAEETADPAAEKPAPPPPGETEEQAEETPGEEPARLGEYVVSPGAEIIGQTAHRLGLRSRFRINLLAISRGNRRNMGRLRTTRIRPGDVLLLQGAGDSMAEFAAEYGCMPLAERELKLEAGRRLWAAVGIPLAAVATAATGLVSAPVAFSAGVLAVMATRVVPPEKAYRAVDWPVIVLLACLLPVAGAMQSTGTADLIADVLVNRVGQGIPVLVLTLLLIVTMTLSDVMNNAATVAVMAPIGYSAATTLDVDPDAFFMAVAIGGSCAFLTPIGHQNNTLILGPGGFRFGDYWPLGLPLEAIVVAVGIPVILLVWGI